MPEHATPDPNLEHLDFLVSSFTDNGKSLRAFTQFQSMQFAQKIESCFTEAPKERPPEVEHD